MSQAGTSGTSLFDSLVIATGIDRLVAPFTVRRLLMRVNVFRIEALTRNDIERVRPHLQSELARYLDAREIPSAMARIDELLSTPPR